MLTAARTWDLNQDGSVSCEEWKAYAGRLFGRFDADPDDIWMTHKYRTMAITDRLFETVPLDYFDTAKTND